MIVNKTTGRIVIACDLAEHNIAIILYIVKDEISHNVPRVGDVALRPTGPKGHVAERRAAAPRSPRRLPRRRCAYALL